VLLYYYPISPFVKKVRAALAEKALAYDRVMVNLQTGEQFAPEFLALNPHAKVPVLVDGEVVVYESSAILDYLDVVQPTPPLWPADRRRYVRARQLEESCDARFYRCLGPLVLGAVASGLSAEETATVERATGEMTEQLRWLGRELEGREYLADDFSAADLAFAAGVGTLERIGFPLPPDLPALEAWRDRMRRRPSWRLALGMPFRTGGEKKPLRQPLWCAECGLPPTDRMALETLAASGRRRHA
jgi:glutathione S-transferase